LQLQQVACCTLQGEDLTFESVAKLWSSGDSSSGSSPTDITGLAARCAAGAGRAPLLDAADIEICVDACGRPLMLACSHSCRVGSSPTCTFRKYR
jgi:hypothetical protein